MRSFLRRYFIPVAENEYKPHAFRAKGALIIAGAALAVELVFLLQSAILQLPLSSYLASVLPDTVVQLTNQERAAYALGTLAPNALLAKAAQLKAEDMAQRGYFSHVTPEGALPWTWLDRVGYHYRSAGENLAVHFFDSQELVDAWMNSPEHRANILANDFTEIGVGMATGKPQGSDKDTVFIVQFFGTPQKTNSLAVAKNSQTPVPQQSATGSSLSPAPIKESAVSREESAEEVRGAATVASSDLAVTNVPNAPAPTFAQKISFFFSRLRTMAGLFASANVFALSKTFISLFEYLLFVGIALALGLAIVIKIRIQYADVILRGALLLLLILGILALNHFFVMTPGTLG